MAVELGRHKDLQQRVIDEVKSVSGPLGYDQARKLEFVNQCVSDTTLISALFGRLVVRY
jgi:hypothetical protein